MLADGDLHGYRVIRGLRDRFQGRYTPSAGSVYPRLRQLEQEGLVEAREQQGRVIYHLTQLGEEALEQRAAELQEMDQEIERRAGELTSDLRSEVRSSARSLRQELEEESRSLRGPKPVFPEELRRELARFSSEWSRLVPPGISPELARSALRQSLQTALEELRRTLDQRPEDG